ncbi:hypothetical protein F5Y13DRAFT_77832 [Hypoxylon sp. FL1857]|nr:hypothetical protein F5Y13DRAFT_77832 [Hypoxylon sp. FL1857]
MDNLPEEIIGIIVSLLPEGPLTRLAPLATLSARWQRAIERRTFSRIFIESKDEDMESFARIVTPVRRAYLRFLNFIVVPLNESDVKPRNTQEQHFNEAFTGAVHRLFQLLADGKSSDVDEETITRGLTLEIGEIIDHGDKRRRLRHRVELLHRGRQLPKVNCVSHLVVYRSSVDQGRWAALRTAVDLAQQLPYLRRIDIIANEMELTGTGGQADPKRLNDREALAAAVVESNFLSDLQHCRKVCLCLEEQDPVLLRMHPRFVFPNCVNSLSYEVLGSAMRGWSHNLVSLDISGVFDGSLFWPSEHESSSTTMPASPWPRLKRFHAKLGITTPAGLWYFIPRSEKGPRDTPCEDTMQPLFESWAKALESTPVIEHASLLFRVELETPDFGSETSVENWVVGFHASGTSYDPTQSCWEFTGLGHYGADYSQHPRLIFKNTNSWRPQKLVMDKLHALGDRFPGREMVDLEVDILNSATET